MIRLLHPDQRRSNARRRPDELQGPLGVGAFAQRLMQVRRQPARELSLEHRRADHHVRSEEHTSELQSRLHLVCRLLLEKKKKQEQHTLKMLDDLAELLASCTRVAAPSVKPTGQASGGLDIRSSAFNGLAAPMGLNIHV